MGKVENTPNVNSLDAYSKDEWVDFLKQGAYRGLKINKVARHIGKSKSCVYDKATHSLELINGKGKTITLDMAKLLKKNERWTLSRFLHNIKMCFSESDYAKNFDIRIMNLAETIIKKTPNNFTTDLNQFIADNQTTSDVKIFFEDHLRAVNESSGNQEIQENLYKLRDKALEKVSNAESRTLAFQIQCTAQAMTPDPTVPWGELPDDVQNLLFKEIYKTEELGNHPLNLISMRFNKNALESKIQWINDDNICLSTQGCKTAKEAVTYVIDHQLTSANLLEFSDFDDADLEKLSENCPRLKKLSIRSKVVSGDKLVEVLKNHLNLQSLNICECNISSDQLLDIAEKLPDLKDLFIENHLKYFTDEFCTRNQNYSTEQLMKMLRLLTTEGNRLMKKFNIPPSKETYKWVG